MKKRLLFRCLSIFSFLILLNCAEIDRNNILDPKNSASNRPSVIIVEGFVTISDNPDQPQYNQYAVRALDKLKKDYAERLLLLIYHRDSRDYSDNRSLSTVEPLYSNYVDIAGGFVGVPDIFINGPLQRVQGASNVNNVYERVNLIISEEIKDLAYFTIEADIELKSNQFEITYRIASLGYKSAENLLLRILFLTGDSGTVPDFLHSVVEMADPVVIEQIDAGEFVEKTVLLEKIEQAERVIIILSDKEQKEIKYAIEKKLP